MSITLLLNLNILITVLYLYNCLELDAINDMKFKVIYRQTAEIGYNINSVKNINSQKMYSLLHIYIHFMG